MPDFDIVRRSLVAKSYRVSKIAADFDLNTEEVAERFRGEITLPESWSIGLIVGNSGTGKSTIARELFGDDVITSFDYSAQSVVDDMPRGCPVDDITRTFYAVGFGSVPSWLKPYHVLSNGEKMRVDIARAILERDFFVFDEFTSVVDRNVAKTVSTAIERCVRKTGKRFVAVSCHRDIIEYLQPDWVFDTDTMQCFFPFAHDREEYSRSDNVGAANGVSLQSIII